MNNTDLYYFFNGLIILMIGLLGGFPFASAIKQKNGKEVAWRVVHSGSSVAGVMLIAIGSVINRLSLSDTINALIFWGIIISTYSFIIGMVLAAISGERGIGNNGEKQSAKWKIVYYLYGLGALISILSLTFLMVVCANQLFVQ